MSPGFGAAPASVVASLGESRSPKMVRTLFGVFCVLVAALATLAFYWASTPLWIVVGILGVVVVIGLYDVFQTRHAILRNFPILGHGRYLLELIRPEINQYFIESDLDGVPVSREKRSVVYQRAKRVTDTIPFGTKADVYEPGYEWVNHSLMPLHVDAKSLRIDVGGPGCSQPYSMSAFNISAMSFGSLSKAAIEALNGGAEKGGFAHNTGEGGVSPYHLNPGGDLIWQIGTGYFGCRNADGSFDAASFEAMASRPNVKMIELKLSQGAKPGHGGILPGSKVTPELAQIRRVKVGETVLSPPSHSSFSDPKGLLEFIEELRTLSGGKPTGFKLCVGKRREFLAICKAMLEFGILPDFIAVDGGEGGTGAAPLEFSNTVGTPLIDGLSFVHNALVGCGLRSEIRVLCSGRVFTGFDIVKSIALGADVCMSARGMMFALGCIQALRCNSNDCPAGVATQNPKLVVGLHVPSKAERVKAYHEQTLHAVAEILGAAGLQSLEDLRPWHIIRRLDRHRSQNYSELVEALEPGCLVRGQVPPHWKRAWEAASAQSFASAVPRAARASVAL